jgi:hypothetical protein
VKTPTHPWTHSEAQQMRRELAKGIERMERLLGRAYYRDAPDGVRSAVDAAHVAIDVARRKTNAWLEARAAAAKAAKPERVP